MKTLFTESSPNIGGQELQALEQMLALRGLRHSVLLACAEQSKSAQEVIKRGIDIRLALSGIAFMSLPSLN